MTLQNWPLFKTLILVVGIIVAAVVLNSILRRLIKVPKKLESKRAHTLVSVAQSIITVVVFSTAIYFIFVLLGIDVTPLIASVGVVGLALGFGARSLVEDLIAGLFLLTQDAISIGDYVKAAGAEGVVEKITLKNISLRDRDGALHIIPNGQVKTVVNLSRGKARVIIDLPIKADQDIDKVLSAIQACLNSLSKSPNGPKVHRPQAETATSSTPAIFPNSGIRGVEDIQPGNRLIIRVVIITRPNKRWEIARLFRYLVKKEFEKQNLSFA